MPSFNFPYTALGLTQAVNLRPNVYGVLQSMNVLPTKPIATTYVRIDIQEGRVKVLPAVQRGGPATPRERISDQAKLIEIPSFPSLDRITPQDIQNMERMEGNVLAPMTKEKAMNDRLDEMRVEHDMTLEYMRMGAIKGIIKDGAGVTLINLFTTFGITKKTVDFDLDNASANIDAACAEVINHIQLALQGETMTGVVMLVDSGFFAKLTSHPKVVDKYHGWMRSQELIAPKRMDEGGQWAREFFYGGILFREYIGSATLQSGATEALIASNTGHAFPVGTRSAFETYLAPPNHMDFVNTPGAQIYLSPEVLKHGEGVEIKGESCPLPVAKMPQVLVECTG